MLNVVEDTLKDNKKGLKGDGEELKGNGVLLFYCIYIHVKVSCIFHLDDNRCIVSHKQMSQFVTFACYKKLMVRVNIDQKICITFS